MHKTVKIYPAEATAGLARNSKSEPKLAYLSSIEFKFSIVWGTLENAAENQRHFLFSFKFRIQNSLFSVS